jgi:hypothetical protein
MCADEILTEENYSPKKRIPVVKTLPIDFDEIREVEERYGIRINDRILDVEDEN